MSRVAFRWLQAVIVVVMLGAVVFNARVLQHRFGSYDLSPLIDSGWRVFSGQIPNRDFICTFPPMLYITLSIAFHVVGVRWEAMALVSGVLAMALCLLGVRLTSLLRSDGAIFVSAVFSVALLIPLFIVGHPWHSALSQAFACYALLATYTLIKLDGAHRVELVTHVVLAAVALLLLKPNIGLPTIALCLLAIGLSRLRVQAVVILFAALLLSSAVLAVYGTNLLITYKLYGHLGERFFANYLLLGVGPRERSLIGGMMWLAVCLPLFPLLGLYLRHLWREPKSIRDPLIILAFAGACITLLGMGTDYEIRIVEAPAILVGFSLLLLERPKSGLQAPLFRAATAIVFVAFFFSVVRGRMQLVGNWGLEACGPPALFTDSFFGHFANCSPFETVLQETDQAVAAHPRTRIFFGPTMEFQYARERVRSPVHLPLWWHPGTSYPRGIEGSVVRSWEADQFDVLVFAHNDRTRIPAAILEDITREYTPTDGYRGIDVYTRK